jgi:tRNA(Glu) U13 pseudouridine synthase TruD
MLIFINAVQSRIFNEVLKRALNEGLDFTKKGHQNCLLMGYKSRFYDGRLGEIEREVLKQNGLELEDFDIKEIGYLRMKGSFRKAVTIIRNLDVKLDEDDEFQFSKKIILTFGLSSGVYATTFLENFFVLN